MKKLILLFLLAIAFAGQSQDNYGEILGKVIDEYGPVPGAVVFTETHGTIYKGRTDDKGSFRISAIPAGKYLLSIANAGDTMYNVLANVPVDGYENLKEITFKSGTMLGPVIITYDPNELHLTYGAVTDLKISSEDIMASPLKNDQKSLLTALSSEIRQTEDGELVFRGARKGDMIYMMDGVKTNDISNVPSSSIGNMIVYTGGIPAKYGDTTGGVVVMETKSYFDLYRAWKRNQKE